MAWKKQTLIDLALYAVLRGVDMKDDDDVTVTIEDVQCDLRTMRIALKFTNGEIQHVGIAEPVSLDSSTLTFESAHIGQEDTLKPNKKRAKRKKRDD